MLSNFLNGNNETPLTTISAVDQFTLNHQQTKTNNDSILPFIFTSMQNKFQNHFPRENLNNQFQSKNILSAFSRDIAEKLFQMQTFQPMSMECSKYQGTHNSHLMNPSSIKNYIQENPQNPEFDLPRQNDLLN